MPERNTVSWNGLISGYIKNRMLKKAREVFDIMPERNVISWTAMVRGYVEEGMVPEAEALFWRMPEKNVISWTVMLGGLIHEGRIDEARRLFDSMPVKDVVTRTSMIGGLCSRGQLDEAREIFDSMRQRNVVSWTTMISGYAQNGKVDVARKLFEVMPEKNEVTWTAMLMGYTQCGRVEDAWELFKAMPTKPVVACNAMIIGLGENGEGVDICLERPWRRETMHNLVKETTGIDFKRFIVRHIADQLRSCSSLKEVESWYALLLKNGTSQDCFLMNQYITSCSDLHSIDSALFAFAQMENPNVFVYNAMIGAFVNYFCPLDGLWYYVLMLRNGVRPTSYTFPAVTKSCKVLSVVGVGTSVHGQVFKSGFSLHVHVQTALVDFYSSLGRIVESRKVFDEMPERDGFAWSAMISAHARAGDLDSAKRVFDEMPEKNTATWNTLIHGYVEAGDVDASHKSSSGIKEDGLNGKQEAENVLKSCIRKIPYRSEANKEVGKKRVQWMDSLGKELAEMKEFASRFLQ
ncbi:Pentatricopeptide repeat-containing protein [Sesamum alatum]|uniref:Pentatricopeptide repeat-containing protein n=1 Tax=Sesamum alatum TaxID=300844 RepID=A0AAE1XK48_9LAMI|nr:Pentatricopeptide repeat-containing protein [Sesamum alatum]